MSIEIIMNESVLSIVLDERCDITEVAAAQAEILRLLPEASRIMVDTLSCDEIDSAVIQWLLVVRRHCETHDIPFRFASLSEAVSEMFSLYRLFDALKEHRVLKAAV